MTTFGGGRQRLAQQVIDQLRAQIETGTLRLGDQLPTEPQLKATFRVSRTVYVVVEAAPRVAGYDPDTTHWTVGVEKLVGGHLFQINVSNGVGTTISQLARGGLSDDTFLGFNITRKFWR